MGGVQFFCFKKGEQYTYFVLLRIMVGIGILQIYTGIFEGGCTQFVHGRNRMTIDPRIPTTPGRHVGFSPTRQTLLEPSAKKRRKVFGESHQG